MPRRIAIGSIFIECNDLTGLLTGLAEFERNEFCRGAKILQIGSAAVGGMLSILREQSADIRPLLVASAISGGPLTADCYQMLKAEMLQRLQSELPVDGVLLALHGAAEVEGIGDLEGDLLAAVRELVGAAIAVVGTLDLHAHVTEAMVMNADALVAWETYPHRDAFTTGVRGARLLFDILERGLRPAMVLAKVPVVVGAVNGGTEGEGPFADLMRRAKSCEGKDGVVSTSIFLVQPYIDAPDMGGGGLVITDGDWEKAEHLARELASIYWESRFDLEPEVYAPATAIRMGLKVEGGPVLLVETADCCGGGAAGDSVAALRDLLETAPGVTAVFPVVDPEAAAACHGAGEGSTVQLELGHKLDPKWGQPLPVTGAIKRLSDGRFRYSGGIWQGRELSMGPSAWLQVGGVGVLIASHPTYDWADEQYRALGMDTGSAKFLVVKNPMNHQLSFRKHAKARFVLDTPGPTPASLRRVVFQNLQRPYFPADPEIIGLEPVVYRRAQVSRK